MRLRHLQIFGLILFIFSLDAASAGVIKLADATLVATGGANDPSPNGEVLTPKLIETTFGCRVGVIPHPRLSVPIVFPE